MDLWRAVARIAEALGDERKWCLVGGLMVALFAIEAGQAQRPTTDIDILGDARDQPSVTEWATEKLLELGATFHEIGGLDAERGFRLEVGEHVVDILAPDGIGRPTKTAGNLQTIQIPGGTQALSRIETVEIVLDGHSTSLRRPTLTGAILLKARALKIHSRPEDQRQDLVRLLSMLDNPRAVRDELKKTETTWLRDAQAELHLDDPSLELVFNSAQLRSARSALQLLIA
jgi:hypothetical protein